MNFRNVSKNFDYTCMSQISDMLKNTKTRSLGFFQIAIYNVIVIKSILLLTVLIVNQWDDELKSVRYLIPQTTAYKAF